MTEYVLNPPERNDTALVSLQMDDSLGGVS